MRKTYVTRSASPLRMIFSSGETMLFDLKLRDDDLKTSNRVSK